MFWVVLKVVDVIISTLDLKFKLNFYLNLVLWHIALILCAVFTVD